jgi:hypothetical protein
MADGWPLPNPPSFNYQAPDGSYESYSDFSRAINGVPCGVECTYKAALRWGLIPPPGYPYYRRHHRAHY